MIEIGRAKRATQVYGFDDIAIVPTRRTRTPEDVKLTWTIDALTFDFPIVAAPMDSVMSPATAIEFGKLVGVSRPQALQVEDAIRRPAAAAGRTRRNQ